MSMQDHIESLGTLRDQFAMAAAAGYFADPDLQFSDAALEIAARNCYRIADAMLNARNVDAS